LDFSKKHGLKLLFSSKVPKMAKWPKPFHIWQTASKKAKWQTWERESVNPSLCLGLPQKIRRMGLYTLGIFEHNIEIKR